MNTPARCPAILIAAPASGQGKTTVTAALARLHSRAGRQVRVFKCGPDFLDPFWHQLASGAPVHQVDLWMTGEADVRARLHAAAQQADVILVEGVMGLFDGNPSAAVLSQHFGLPVLAVIDASAMAGTFAAIAFGLQHYRPNLPWAGVLANRVGSVGHGAMLSGAPNYSPMLVPTGTDVLIRSDLDNLNCQQHESFNLATTYGSLPSTPAKGPGLLGQQTTVIRNTVYLSFIG